MPTPELESARAFARHVLVTKSLDVAEALIEDRDAAVALRAKRELLEEIRVGVRESGWNAWLVLVNMSNKYELPRAGQYAEPTGQEEK
jgi:hypothetical protein